jgi:hypothetical protein
LVKKAASRARTYQAARCTVGERRNDRERNDLARQATRDAVHALAEELKQEVRVRLAAHLQDAAATDGLMHRGVSADLSPADIVDEPGDEITGIQTRDEPSGYVRQYDFGRTGLVIVDTSTPHAVMSWSGDRLAGRFLQACRALAGQPGASAIVVVNGQRKSGPGPDVVFQCLDEHDAAELDEDCDFVRVDGDDFAVAYHRMPHPGGNGAVVVSFVGMRRHGPDALELVRRTASPSMVRSVRSVMRLEFPAALAGWSAAGTADLFNQRHSAPAAIASIPREASSGRH